MNRHLSYALVFITLVFASWVLLCVAVYGATDLIVWMLKEVLRG